MMLHQHWSTWPESQTYLNIILNTLHTAAQLNIKQPRNKNIEASLRLLYLHFINACHFQIETANWWKKKLSKKSYSQLDPFLGQIIKVFILNTYFRLNLIIFLWNQIESSKFCGSLNKYQPFRTQRLEYCSSKFESWAKHLYFRNSINPSDSHHNLKLKNQFCQV